MIRQMQMRQAIMKMVVKYYLIQCVLTNLSGGHGGGCELTPDEQKAIILAFWL